MNANQAALRSGAANTVLTVLGAISFCHFLNDLIQSLLPAIYPLLKTNYALAVGTTRHSVSSKSIGLI